MRHSDVKKTTASKPRRGYRGLSADELDDERRARVIKAAIELFALDGFATTRIDSICKRARVSTRHFYELFNGRNDVLEAAYDDVVIQVEIAIRGALVKRGAGLDQRLADATEAAVYRLLAEPALARIVCIEIIGVSEALERKRLESMAQLAALVQRYLDRQRRSDGAAPGDYYLPVLASIGIFRELIAIWLAGRSDLSAEDAASQARQIFSVMIGTARHYLDDEAGVD